MALVSAVLIVLDTNTRLLEPARDMLGSAVMPIRITAESPFLISGRVGDLVATRDDLQHRNAELESRLLEMSQIAQQYRALEAENERLRELLGSRARLPAEVLIAEIVGILPAPNTHQVIIDKGRQANVREGDAVIDAAGLYGQVVEVNRSASRVMLLTDVNHAVPVQVNRNGVRSIAGGTGRFDRLQLENVSITADIQEGDLLETSGLGGRFPPGYPVGTVDSVVIEPTSAFASVTVRPLAELDRSRHVLVVMAAENRADDVEADAASATGGGGAEQAP
ncbi:MAG: rod shape-determining protein MreC [Pseudomonadales bacterium]